MKSKLEQLFADAVAAGYTKPVLRTLNFKYKQAPAHGRNPGAIYITELDTSVYVGKIFDGAVQLISASNRDKILAEIYETVEHPQIAAVKFGHQTGQCSICGRPLANKLSIALGIGPICNEKFGWALPDDYYDDTL